MKKYEIMFIVRPDVEDAGKSIFSDMEKVLTAHKATITLAKELGQKQLAYEIEKQKTGFYFIYNIETETDEAIKEFDRLALINDKVIRHLIIKLEK